MKPNKPIKWVLPEKLCREMEAYLKVNKPNFYYRIEYFYYILHLLIAKSNKHKKYDFHVLNKEKLKIEIVNNISRYIKILHEGGFIKSDFYKPGEKALWYNISPEYKEGFREVELLQGTRLHDKIIKQQRRTKAHDNRLESFLKQMKAKFFGLEFDYDEAYKWIITNASPEKQPYYLTSINAIQDKRFRYFKRNGTNNRLDSNLTNLKSELRQFFKGDLVSIDLKNSQPFLLSILINQILATTTLNNPLCCHFSDLNISKAFGIRTIKRIQIIHQKFKNMDLVNLKQFADSTANGMLYDDFCSVYPGDLNREEVKQVMFNVLFSRNEQTARSEPTNPIDNEKAIFHSVYPFIYEATKILKAKDHTKLAITLQKMESQLYIDIISKELVDQIITPLTIHDSIIIERNDLDQANKTISSMFQQHCGIVPTFHIKDLKS
jgi:hypothetical protein